MKKFILSSFTFVLLFCFSFSSNAITTAGAISSATGGTGRGTIEPVDSILLNPAIVAQLNAKFFSVNYTKNQWGITIADNGKEALFPAALAFVHSETDLVNTQQISLVLSKLIAPYLSIGATISMVDYDQQKVVTDQKYRQTTGQVAVAYMPSKDFGFGLVANKIYSNDIQLDPNLQLQKTFGIGMNYTYLSFIRLRLDVESAPENKTNRLVYMSGLETYINDWIVVRLGYQNNNVVQKNFATAGLGFAGPQFGLHYGYMHNVVDSSEDKHSIDLGIPF